MNFEYKEQYSKLTNACLNLTDACNLECRYCFVAQKPHYMTYEVAKDAAEWIVQNLHWKKEHNLVEKDTKAHITYFGGEPTLLWDQIIVPLTKYLTEVYPREINFNITTNGTLLNEERIKFMSDYEIYPLLSIDGGPETQSYNRPCRDHSLNSFDLVVKNIPILLKYFPNTTFRSTIAEETVSHTFENYIFAQYMGFKNIYMMPNGRTRWKQENLDILADEFKKIYMYMINCFEHNQMPPINMSPINDSFKRILQHNNYVLKNKYAFQKRNIMRCGLGTGMGSISYDGTIYGCQEQDSYGEESHFYLRNIYTGGIDKEIHSIFLQEYLNIEKTICGEEPSYCDDCPLGRICGELNCPSSSYDLFKSFGKDNYVHCFWFRTMYEQASIALKYLENNDIFMSYLKKNCGYNYL